MKISLNSTENLFYISNILSKSLPKFSANYFKFKGKVGEMRLIDFDFHGLRMD